MAAGQGRDDHRFLEPGPRDGEARRDHPAHRHPGGAGHGRRGAAAAPGDAHPRHPHLRRARSPARPCITPSGPGGARDLPVGREARRARDHPPRRDRRSRGSTPSRAPCARPRSRPARSAAACPTGRATERRPPAASPLVAAAAALARLRPRAGPDRLRHRRASGARASTRGRAGRSAAPPRPRRRAGLPRRISTPSLRSSPTSRRPGGPSRRSPQASTPSIRPLRTRHRAAPDLPGLARALSRPAAAAAQPREMSSRLAPLDGRARTAP